MPERVAPSVLLDNTNLSGGVTDIDEDPDSPDANWMEAVLDSNNTVCRVGFPTPSGNLDPATDAQEFRIWVRKSATGGGTPDVAIVLYENGTAVSTLVSGVSITSESGQLVSVLWDADLLADLSGVDVECLVQGNSAGGGPNERSVDVGAVEWNAEVAAAIQENVSDGVEAGEILTGAYEFALQNEAAMAGESVTSIFAKLLQDTGVAGDTVAENVIDAPVSGEVVITFN